MKLVTGLGNPGSQYERTRHNAGFRIVDKIAAKFGWKWTERRSRAVLASGTTGSEKVVLVKPLTFMNVSGEDRAVEAVEIWIAQGIDAAMNLVNADPEAQQKALEKQQRQKERQERARLRRETALKEQEAQADQISPATDEPQNALES